MKKENIYKFLYVVLVLLIVSFCIILGLDYLKYDLVNNSAPFYIFIFVRVLEFIVPSIIIFIVAKFLKKRYVK